MQRAGIAADRQGSAASEGDQLAQGATHSPRCSVTAFHYCLREASLAGPVVYEESVSVTRELPRHSAVTLGRPLLGATACARIQQHERLRLRLFKIAVAPHLRRRIARKNCRGRFRRASERRSERKILLDHMCALSLHLLLIEPAGWSFARRGETHNLRCSRPTRNHRRANRTLEVNRSIVSRPPDFAETASQVCPRSGRQRASTPRLCANTMYAIYGRFLFRKWTIEWVVTSTQQLRPALLNHPSNCCFRQRLPQRRRRRQCVDYVPHGTQADYQQPTLRCPFHLAQRAWSEARADNFTCGMILGITHNLNPASIFPHDVPFRNALDRVVRAFGVNVGMDFAHDRAHIRFGKYYDGVDALQCRENLRTFPLRHKRPSDALQSPHGIIGVDGDDQLSAKSFRRPEIPDVSDVQQVEATVGKRHRLSGLAPSVDEPNQFPPGYD